MEKLPNILTEKDILYLTDMFNWNKIAYEKIAYYLEEATDEDIIKALTKIMDIHLTNCNSIINILKEGK